MDITRFGIDPTILVMIIVAVAIILLVIIVWLFSAVANSSAKRKKAQEAATAVVAAPTPKEPIAETPVPVAIPEAVAAGISPKTVAAIMAAVSMASGSPHSKLRFTAIRRGATTANAWAASSTADIIANRQAYL